MNKSNKVKLGIIGSGWVAVTRHLPAFKRLDNVIVEAICSLDLNTAKKVAKKFKIPQVFTNVDEFLTQQIDAVSICTPPQTHAELIRKSLEAGLHVLVEKPMVMTKKEGESLANLAREKRLILMPSHNFLFCNSVLEAKKFVKEGKLGTILGGCGVQWSSWQRQLPTWYKELPGGLFFDESPHLIYLLRYFLGNLTVEKAWYYEKELENSEIFQRFEIILQGERGYGTLSMWFGAPISEWWLYLHGTKGTIIIDIFRDMLYFFSKERRRTPWYLIKTSLSPTLSLYKRFIIWGLERYLLGKSNLFGTDYIAKAFINAILKKTSPPISAEDGYEVIGIINEILKQCGLLGENY